VGNHLPALGDPGEHHTGLTIDTMPPHLRFSPDYSSFLPMIRSLIALVVAVAVAPHGVHAQTHPLAGDWSVSLASGMRIENGEQTIITQKGTMSVVIVGDSIIATLKMQPPEGMPARPASRLAAKLAAGKVVFTDKREATVSMNGEEQKVMSTSTFTFDPSGDVLAGTVSREIQGMGGMGGMGAQPITGARIKH